jgi:hypothetical protein
MKTKLLLSFVLAANLLFSQNNKEFDSLPSGIYFKDGNQVTALDPTVVNIKKKGSLANPKAIGEIPGKEANYSVNSTTKFYFKFKPEEKELNSSNANATNKVGEENYLNILMSGLNSKAISPNEFKLIKLKVRRGKRSYMTGKYGAYGMTYENSLNSKEIANFKYKKIDNNLYEIYFQDLKPGEYCFVYMDNSKSNLAYLNTNNNSKVFDFSVK